MRKTFIAMTLLGAFALTGCSLSGGGKSGDQWKLPQDPVSFEEKYDDELDQVSYEYNGRKYSLYGTQGARLTDDTIRECLGYVGNDKNTRIYTLSEDPYENYLMICNVEGFMEQPTFARATDTKNKAVFTPEYIRSLSYEYWGSSGEYREFREARIELICNVENITDIGYTYDINGKDGGTGDTSYAKGGVIDKGELFTFGITEVDIKDKADPDKPFNVNMSFTVTDKDGNSHKVEGTFEHEMMLGSSLNNLEIRNDPNGGYVLFVDK